MRKTVTKIIITVVLLVVFMMVLPWLAIKFADGWAVTGLWMFAFFTVNPALVIGLSIMAGTELRRLWWIPVAIFVLFPLLFGVAIGEFVWDLYVYSAIYLPIGILAMLGTHFGKKLILKKKGGEVKKTFKIIGLCCVAVIIIVGIHMTIPSKTLDFHGTVKEIEIIDNNTVIHISTTETSYTVVANKKTNVSYCCKEDPDINLSDIKVGDTIQGDYRWLSKNNVAKFITVEYHSQETNELFDLTTEPNSSETLKIVTEKEIYSIEDKVIKYSITNLSDFEQCIAGDDDCFSLQMLVNDEWKRVGTKKEHYWNSLGLILPSMDTEQREINLDEYFNLPLNKGTYRIAVENLVSNTFEIS